MTEYFDPLVAAIEPAVNAFVTTVVSEATTSLQTQLTETQSDLNSTMSQLTAATAEINDLNAQLATKTNQVATLIASNQTLTTQRDQAVAAKTQLQAQLQSAQAQVLQLQARVAELEAQLPDEPRPLLLGASATANSAKGTTSDLAEFQRLQSITGKKLARRTFETVRAADGAKVTPTWAKCKAAADIANGVTSSVISWKVDLDKVGTTDPTELAHQKAGWKTLIESMPSDVPEGYTIYVTIHHEMDPEVDPAVYIAAYRNWSAWVDEFRGTRPIVKFWCPTGWAFYTGNGDPTRAAERWYPGDEYVEMVAADTYNRSTTKYNALSSEITGAPGAYRFAKAHGKRFGIPEFGCYSNAGNLQAKFITDAKTWLASLGANGDGPTCELALWFHSAIGASEDPKGFWLDLVPETLAAWKAAV